MAGALKVALVGCGKIADGHAEQIGKLPELARLVAVCDSEPLMAERLAQSAGGLRHYHDYEGMLERERPDVVHVTSPPESHFRLATLAIDAGAHVYVEKPLTTSRGDDVALVARARAADRKLTVGYTYLYDPPARIVRELCAAGAIGTPVHAESIYGYDLAGAFGQALLRDPRHWVHRRASGLVHNNVDHLLNKLGALFDDDEPAIAALGYRLADARHGDRRDALVDELRVTLHGGGMSAMGMFSCHARPVMHRLTVHGTRDTVTADWLARTVTLARGRDLPSALGRMLPAFEQAARFFRAGASNVAAFARSELGYFAGLEELIRRFYRSIADGVELPISYRDILWVSRAVHEVTRQLEAGGALREVA